MYFVLKIFSRRVTFGPVSVVGPALPSTGETPRRSSLEDLVRKRSMMVFITVPDGDDGLAEVLCARTNPSDRERLGGSTHRCVGVGECFRDVLHGRFELAIAGKEVRNRTVEKGQMRTAASGLQAERTRSLLQW